MKTIGAAHPVLRSGLQPSAGPAPWLGQHTVVGAVASSAWTDDELESLLSDGTLYDAHPELQERQP